MGWCGTLAEVEELIAVKAMAAKTAIRSSLLNDVTERRHAYDDRAGYVALTLRVHQEEGWYEEAAYHRVFWGSCGGMSGHCSAIALVIRSRSVMVSAQTRS